MDKKNRELKKNITNEKKLVNKNPQFTPGKRSDKNLNVNKG